MIPCDVSHLEQLRKYYDEHGVFPPYSTITTLFGYKSKSTAWMAIDRLIEAEYIDTTPERRLKPGKRFFDKE